MGNLRLVEEAHRDSAVGKRSGKHVHRAAANAFRLLSEGVLVYRYELAVGDDVQHGFGYLADVIAEDERRTHHTPQREVGEVLIVSQFAVAHFQHIGVVEVTGRGIFPELYVAGINGFYPIPPRTDVRGRAPHIPGGRTPQPRLAEAPFAYGETDWPHLFAALCGDLRRSVFQRVRHFPILYCRAVAGICHGIAEFYCVPARIQADDGLETRGKVEMFLRRKLYPSALSSVHGDGEIFFVPAVFFYLDREHIFPVRVHHDVVENYTPLALVKPGHILSALQGVALSAAGKPFQYAVGHLIFDRLPAAER